MRGDRPIEVVVFQYRGKERKVAMDQILNLDPMSLDTVPTLDLIQVEDVVKWVDQDEALAKIRRNAELIKAALLNQQITGRMLMHLAKEDLMRMGIQVINMMPFEALPREALPSQSMFN